MKNLRSLAGIALSVIVLTTTVSAAFAKNEWQARDEQRIHEGIRNGTINPYEARSLHHRNYKINKYAARAHRSGGHIGAGERIKIQSMKASERVAIFHDKHDKY